MRLIKKIIFTGFAPNITIDDVKIVLGFLLLPWRWLDIKQGKHKQKAENSLRQYFNIKNAFVFDSGRSALFHALTALGVGKDDKVFVQAYTCVVVINAIKQTGAKPIYIDIGDDFNMKPEDLRAKASSVDAKVLIIQHTFGNPAKLDELLSIADEHGLKTVEDCAHSLGVKHNNVLTGTRSDIGMFSFGSDKIISCVRAGALITNNDELSDKLFALQRQLPEPSLKYTLQHLIQIPVFMLGKFFYGIWIGKLFLALTQRMRIINRIVYPPEKQGCAMKGYPTQLANSLAKILCWQLGQVDKLNEHRQYIARLYFEGIRNKQITLPVNNEESVYLRFTILMNNPKKLHKYAKREGIILGNWYNSVVAPDDTVMANTDYVDGSCPRAEFLAHRSINLPTNRNITKADAEYIIKIVNQI